MHAYMIVCVLTLGVGRDKRKNKIKYIKKNKRNKKYMI